MFKKWKKEHTISVWSHFYSLDFPFPYTHNSFYEDAVRNIFIDKNSRELVELELTYSSSLNEAYQSIKVIPRYGRKIKNIVNVPKFIEWLEKKVELNLPITYENEGKIVYYGGDGYTRCTVSIVDSEERETMKIELEFGKYIW